MPGAVRMVVRGPDGHRIRAAVPPPPAAASCRRPISAEEFAHLRHFGRQLQRARCRAGWGKARLSAQVGLSADHLARLERGVRRPRAAVVAELAEVLARGERPRRARRLASMLCGAAGPALAEPSRFATRVDRGRHRRARQAVAARRAIEARRRDRREQVAWRRWCAERDQLAEPARRPMAEWIAPAARPWWLPQPDTGAEADGSRARAMGGGSGAQRSYGLALDSRRGGARRDRPALSEDEQEAIYALALDGCGRNRIAAELNRSAGAVSKHARRLRIVFTRSWSTAEATRAAAHWRTSVALILAAEALERATAASLAAVPLHDETTLRAFDAEVRVLRRFEQAKERYLRWAA